MATEISSSAQETYTIKGNPYGITEENDGPTDLIINSTEGLKAVERFFEVPLDYSNPSGEKIVVFARQTIPLNKAKTKEEEEKLQFGTLCTISTKRSQLNSISYSGVSARRANPICLQKRSIT
jgi:hypothetical protein